MKIEETNKPIETQDTARENTEDTSQAAETPVDRPAETLFPPALTEVPPAPDVTDVERPRRKKRIATPQAKAKTKVKSAKGSKRPAKTAKVAAGRSVARKAKAAKKAKPVAKKAKSSGKKAGASSKGRVAKRGVRKAAKKSARKKAKR